MSKKISRIIGIIMLIIAIIFIIFALSNPQASFSWSNGITYAIYIIYSIAMVFFLIAPFNEQ